MLLSAIHFRAGMVALGLAQTRNAPGFVFNSSQWQRHVCVACMCVHRRHRVRQLEKLTQPNGFQWSAGGVKKVRQKGFQWSAGGVNFDQ
jgi:hypothetical protein